MFLSIIIPVYNAEKYLAECLDSCLNQDIPHEDYEIICVNDGSKDGSAAILDRYAAKYPNVRVFHKENAGVSEARNDGFSLARGTYIWFVDNDDLLADSVLGILKSHTTSNTYDRITFPSYTFHGSLTDNEVELRKQHKLSPDLAATDNVVWTSILLRRFLSEHAILHRSKKSSTFDTSMSTAGYGVDTLFIYECQRSKPIELHLTTTPLYLYRIHPNSVTKQFSLESQRIKVSEYAHMAHLIRDDLRFIPFSDQKLRTFAANRMMVMLRKAMEIVAQLPQPLFSESVSYLRELGMFPFSQPSECTYTWQECANEPSGTGKLRNIFRYYSIHPVGLFLAAMPYRLQRLKIRLSRFLRKNPLTNCLLDLKNKLLRR